MIGSLFVTSLLYFVLLLSLCQVLCGKVYATNESPPGVPVATQGKKNNIELFKTGEITVELNSTGHTVKQTKFNVNDYYSPVVVSAGDVFVALTGVNYTSVNTDNEKNITIVTKYIATEKQEKWGEKVVTSGENGKWKSQFAVQHEIGNIDGQTSVVKGMLAVAKDDKIYVLLVNCSNKNNGDSNNDANCDFNITVGTVTGEKTADKKITWDDGKLNEKTNVQDLIKNLKEEKNKVFPSGGTAFITADEKVVFVGLIANENKKNVFVVIYSKGDEGNNEFKVSKEENVDGCTLSFFPWGENKIIMIPTHCTADSEKKQKVKESSNLGNEWTESTGPFARLLNFMQDKTNFTTTKINETNILLFTKKKLKTTEGAVTKNDAHMWFTDGQRVSTAGRIVTDDNITSASLLHINGELFALHQNWDDKGQQKNITLTRMEEQLNDITTVITAWKKSDEVVINLCKELFASSQSLKATDSLVGFLSKNSESNESWTDEYYYVNATVKNGGRVDGGFTFNGKNAGAKWPVGKLKEDQPYNFTDPGFTLVANVTVDGVTNGKDNSVLGVVYKSNGEEKNNDEKTFGLRCTAKGEWKITGNGESHETVANGKQCNIGSAYLVALILNKSELSVYIDGEELAEKEREIKIEKSHNITHFYFGARSDDDESHVTVKNVLLYNRPFTTDEVGKLIIPKKIKPSKPINDRRGGNETPKDKGGDGESPSRSSRTGEVEEKSTSRPESSTVRGGYVGVVVCFVMLAHALCFL